MHTSIENILKGIQILPTWKNLRFRLHVACLVSFTLGAVLWHSRPLSFCVCFLIGFVSSISKDGWRHYCSQTKHNFLWLIHRGSFLECWWFSNVTAIQKGAPSIDKENSHPISITPFFQRCMRS